MIRNSKVFCMKNPAEKAQSAFIVNFYYSNRSDTCVTAERAMYEHKSISFLLSYIFIKVQGFWIGRRVIGKVGFCRPRNKLRAGHEYAYNIPNVRASACIPRLQEDTAGKNDKKYLLHAGKM